jgi:hypothetical protein
MKFRNAASNLELRVGSLCPTRRSEKVILLPFHNLMAVRSFLFSEFMFRELQKVETLLDSSAANSLPDPMNHLTQYTDWKLSWIQLPLTNLMFMVIWLGLPWDGALTLLILMLSASLAAASSVTW